MNHKVAIVCFIFGVANLAAFIGLLEAWIFADYVPINRDKLFVLFIIGFVFAAYSSIALFIKGGPDGE